MKAVADAADDIREHRKPAAEDNPFLALQESISKNIVSVLDKWRDTQETISEALFLGIYGSPALQAAVRIKAGRGSVAESLEMSPEYRKRLDARIAELKSQIGAGGLKGMRHSRSALRWHGCRGMVDERSYEALPADSCGRRQLATDACSVQDYRCASNSLPCCCALEPEASLAAIPKLLRARRRRTSYRSGCHSRCVVRERGDVRRNRNAAQSSDTTVRLGGRTASESVIGLCG